MIISKRRRIEGKTNYRKRLILLKGRCPRLAVRKTNRYINLQIIDSKIAQDSVLYFVSTKELLKYGWPKDKKNSLKSIPASYLGGLLLGKKAKNVKKLILDMGLVSSTKGSRIYAAVKGVQDSGININLGKEIIPSADRLSGKHIALKEFDKIKENINKK